jgi:hypothetical protein
MVKIFIHVLIVFISNMLSSEMLSQATQGATVHHQHYKDTIKLLLLLTEVQRQRRPLKALVMIAHPCQSTLSKRKNEQ